MLKTIFSEVISLAAGFVDTSLVVVLGLHFGALSIPLAEHAERFPYDRAEEQPCAIYTLF